MQGRAARVWDTCRAGWAALAAPARLDRDTERWTARVLLAAAVLFTAWFARAEITVDAPPAGDRALHITLANGAVRAIGDGADPTDQWVPEIAAGYPAGHHYQHLTHVVTAFLHRLCGGMVSPSRLLGVLTWCCLLAFPWSCYAAARRLGLARLAAAATGFLGPLPAVLSTIGTEYGGLEYGTYLAGGFGMTPQAAGAVLLPLAVADGIRACRTGRRLPRAALWCGLLVPTHMLSAYVAAVSVALGAAVLGGPWRPRLGRLALIGTGAAVLCAYFLVPFWLDGGEFSVSPHVPSTKRDSFGHLHVLGRLFTGGLFDAGRLPVLTVLVALGTAVAVARRAEPHMRVLLSLGVVWLALYFGRPTWGPLYALLPFGAHLHLHRFIIGVHLAGILLAGVGGGALLRCALRPGPLWRRTAGGFACALLILPAHVERAEALEWSGRWQRETQAAWLRDGPDFVSALGEVRGSPAGRLYVGMGDNWGRQYRFGHTPAYAVTPAAGFDSLGYLFYEFVRTGDVQLHFNERDPGWYQLFNVRHAVLPAGREVPPFYELRGQFGRHALYGVRTAGYCSLVDAPITLHGDPSEWYGAMGPWIASPMLAAGQHPLIDFDAAAEATPGSGPLLPFRGLQPDDLTPRTMPPEPRGAVVSESADRGSFSARVDVRRACWLLLRVNFHPGWHCEIDGRPVAPRRLAPSFVGVPLQPGAREVRFEYRAPFYRWWLLLLGPALLAGWAWWRRRAAMAVPAAPAAPDPA
ncbi:MAG: hypothetical protein ACYTGX_00055 [Planctomycetota bacterium]|jgi:hypothetical protein